MAPTTTHEKVFFIGPAWWGCACFGFYHKIWNNPPREPQQTQGPQLVGRWQAPLAPGPSEPQQPQQPPQQPNENTQSQWQSVGRDN